ncbi:hypothetical protein N665_0972s0010 [Sinapis alba]|nr:hypothetical protein N665_0972s0010 [Sinapis alba]
MNNNKADQCILHNGHHQLLQSTDPSINALVKTSSLEFLITCDGVRRRRSSKGSRRTMPTRLLKANPNNFRALVQKYTGRSTGRSSGGRKGPVTLDFRSPASELKEVIFPSSGDIQNYDSATYRREGYGESHVTCEREGTKAASYPMCQLSSDYAVCGGYDDHAHGHHDHNHDDHDLVREYLENSSFNGVNCDDFYHDTVLLEEFMRDLDF